MKKNPVSTNVIKSEVRRARSELQVGVGARCAQCGETRSEALIRGSAPMVCAECQRKSLGMSTDDAHHVAGQNNSPETVLVPANDHRAELSPLQYEWPRMTLENPTGDPLRAAAGWVRGAADMIMYLVEKFLIRAAELLEAAADFFEKAMGPNWWTGTAIAAYAPQGAR